MKAFSRSIAIFNAIAAAMSIGDATQRLLALRDIPEYNSRGKGRARGPQRTLGVTYRAARRNNALVPVGTQGKRECARRVRQMARAA